MFWHALLHRALVMPGYLSNYCLLVNLNQPCYSPLTSLINTGDRTAAHWMFFVLCIILCKLETVVVKTKEISSLGNSQNQLVWHQQSFHSQNVLDHISSPLCCLVSRMGKKCYYALSYCHITSWLCIYIHEQTKLPVSVDSSNLWYTGWWNWT